VLARELRDAGIESLEQLAALGFLEGVRRLRAAHPERDCVNAGLALAGAIRGQRWMSIPKDVRLAISRELRELG